jgi:uncharacterized protein YbcI
VGERAEMAWRFRVVVGQPGVLVEAGTRTLISIGCAEPRLLCRGRRLGAVRADRRLHAGRAASLRGAYYHPRWKARESEIKQAIADAVGRVMADLIGRGPTQINTYINGNVIVCITRDTMTHGERSLAAEGCADDVREMRRRIQDGTRATVSRTIDQLTGCRVLSCLPTTTSIPNRQPCASSSTGPCSSAPA